MTDTQPQRHPRRTTAVIVGVLVVVILAVAGIGVLTSGAATPASTTQPPAAASTETPTTAATATPLATATTPAPTSTPTPTPTPTPTSAVPTPQPTKTATISKPAPITIKQQLSASVIKMEAITGTASGPGEIAGPSVRFTIRITNTTGKSVALSDTVVNAYYGTAATPAVQLSQPGAKDFPASVKNGSSATGVFVFNIPTASRSTVKVTVDTSVQNPVIAFQGPAPR